jgi:hypothetical protein
VLLSVTGKTTDNSKYLTVHRQVMNKELSGPNVKRVEAGKLLSRMPNVFRINSIHSTAYKAQPPFPMLLWLTAY